LSPPPLPPRLPPPPPSPSAPPQLPPPPRAAAVPGIASAALVLGLTLLGAGLVVLFRGIRVRLSPSRRARLVDEATPQVEPPAQSVADDDDAFELSLSTSIKKGRHARKGMQPLGKHDDGWAKEKGPRTDWQLD